MSDHHVICGKCGIGVNFVCDNCKQEEPCPWCHGLRSNFRSGDMGYGEEDFDAASSCPSSTQRHPCEERVRRVNAEFERNAALARAGRAEAEFDRLRQDRADALNVRSRDGLLSSEWVARTGKAERERDAALAREREAERLLRLVCERINETPVSEQSRELADIAIAVEMAYAREHQERHAAEAEAKRLREAATEYLSYGCDCPVQEPGMHSSVCERFRAALAAGGEEVKRG